jgi:hypothetical protein
MEFDMTEEDEAFDEIARKQGMWGGGFMAKKAMAADKLWDRPSVAFDEWWNGDQDENTNPFRLESGAYWAWAGWKAALAQPAQEPVAQGSKEHLKIMMEHSAWDDRLELSDALANIDDFYATAPPKRTWVGLTPEETSGFTQHEMTVVKYVSKVLQEKNG